MDHKPTEFSMTSPSNWKPIVIAELILAVAMFLMLGAGAYVGQERSGSAGITAAFVVLLVCWIPNAVSLLVMGLIRDPQLSVSAMLLSMLIRMGIPMAFVVFLMQSRHWLGSAGASSMVVVFYLVALVVETPLSLWVIKMSRAPVVKVS